MLSAARIGGRGNNDRRNNNWNGRTRPLQFPNKTPSLLTLCLPVEGRGATQFEDFHESLLTYVGNNVKKSTARTWLVEYFTSDNSSWEPQPPSKPEKDKFMKDDGNGGKTLDRDAYDEAMDDYKHDRSSFRKNMYENWPPAKQQLCDRQRPPVVAAKTTW